ncbi:MAG: hypothetical protein PHU23_01155 [Dehalococcoidales bacterium]|nr:hypothetical protein [Dehalococcoidales bacterium]
MNGVDINFDNPDLRKLNPELGTLLGGKPIKKQKYNNTRVTDPDGEKYDSGKEAEDARNFSLAVRAGEYLFYKHHFTVPLKGGVKFIIDHMLVNNQMQLEFFDSKPYDDRKQKFICEDDFVVKKKTFEDMYGFKLTLI